MAFFARLRSQGQRCWVAARFTQSDGINSEMMAWLCSAHDNAGLVNNLFRAGEIRSERVRSAMMQVDRGKYSFDPGQAYMDNPHYIGFGATISAPHMHAMCLQALEPMLREGARVLDVGCGSGYLTAALAYMVGETGKVYGIDHIKGLVDFAIHNTRQGNPDLLETGRVEYADIPPELVHQLKPNGTMVLPVGRRSQELVLVTKPEAGDKCTVKALAGVRYVPLTTPDRQLQGGM